MGEFADRGRFSAANPWAIEREKREFRARPRDDTTTITERAPYDATGRGGGAHVDLWVSVRRTRGPHLSAKTIHRCPTVSRPVLFVRQTALSPIFRRKNRQKKKKKSLRTAPAPPLRTSLYAERERQGNDLFRRTVIVVVTTLTFDRYRKPGTPTPGRHVDGLRRGGRLIWIVAGGSLETVVPCGTAQANNEKCKC